MCVCSWTLQSSLQAEACAAWLPVEGLTVVDRAILLVEAVSFVNNKKPQINVAFQKGQFLWILTLIFSFSSCNILVQWAYWSPVTYSRYNKCIMDNKIWFLCKPLAVLNRCIETPLGKCKMANWFYGFMCPHHESRGSDHLKQFVLQWNKFSQLR